VGHRPHGEGSAHGNCEWVRFTGRERLRLKLLPGWVVTRFPPATAGTDGDWATASLWEGESLRRVTPSAQLSSKHELLSWEEAAAYLGPSFTPRWVRRQVYEFKTIKAVLLGGRRVVPKSELDRYVAESMIDAMER
jgi:hypothetical protein